MVGVCEVFGMVCVFCGDVDCGGLVEEAGVGCSKD